MDQVAETELAALEEERAFLDRSSWRKVQVPQKGRPAAEFPFPTGWPA